jgi:hypothetical protein
MHEWNTFKVVTQRREPVMDRATPYRDATIRNSETCPRALQAQPNTQPNPLESGGFGGTPGDAPAVRSVFGELNSSGWEAASGLDGCGWNPVCYVAGAATAVATGVSTAVTDAATGVSNAADWVEQNPAEAAGVVLGVAAAATGFGAIVEGSLLLSGVAISSGLAASALDGQACLANGGIACVGLGLGATGAIFSLPEFALGLAGASETSMAFGIARGCSAAGWSFGVAGTIVDAFHNLASR